MKSAFKLTALLALAAALPLQAVGPPTLPSAADFSAQILPEMEGTVSWRTLSQVQMIPANGKVTPKFSDEILALDKKEVRIYGFMLPLNMGDNQTHFIISAVPPSCPYCMPAGPDTMVEVMARTPVKFGFEAVVVSGRLTVLKDDAVGLLYRITDATPVAAATPAKR